MPILPRAGSGITPRLVVHAIDGVAVRLGGSDGETVAGWSPAVGSAMHILPSCAGSDRGPDGPGVAQEGRCRAPGPLAVRMDTELGDALSVFAKNG